MFACFWTDPVIMCFNGAVGIIIMSAYPSISLFINSACFIDEAIIKFFIYFLISFSFDHWTIIIFFMLECPSFINLIEDYEYLITCMRFNHLVLHFSSMFIWYFSIVMHVFSIG